MKQPYLRNLLIPFFITVVLAFASAAFGQRLDGTLRGTVLDPAGAVVPDAEVTATNQATSVALTTQTSSVGIYIFPNLLVGNYTLTVKAKGFATYVRRDVSVASNQVVEATLHWRWVLQPPLWK